MYGLVVVRVDGRDWVAGTAIVVGGGIGGLATTIGLERAGWQVTVFERAEAFRPVGAGLTLAPNAVRAVDWFGLGDQLRSRGMVQGAAGIRAASGRWLLREDIGEVQWRFGIRLATMFLESHARRAAALW